MSIDNESKVNFDKISDYLDSITTSVTDALEQMIAESKSGQIYLNRFRSVLDTARERLAGFHGPMNWSTKSEATRYIESHNEHLIGERYEIKESGDKFQIVLRTSMRPSYSMKTSCEIAARTLNYCSFDDDPGDCHPIYN